MEINSDRSEKTEWFYNVANVEDLLIPANGYLHDGSIVVEADFSIIYSLLLVIEDCNRLFKEPKFTRSSWQLGYPYQTKENKYISRPQGICMPNHQLATVENIKSHRISVLNDNESKHLISEKHGQVCTDEYNIGWGNPKIATLEELLDKKNGFLHNDDPPEMTAAEKELNKKLGILPNVSIHVLAKFSIKSFDIDPKQIT